MSGGAQEDPLVRELLDVASRAAEVVRRVYTQGFEVQYKGPEDPVTSADRAANELICGELARRFPGVPIVAEESDPDSYAAFQKSEQAFFVDPIDGTREFVARKPEFVVMIGWAQHGKAKVGVVTSPTSGVSWFGRVGQGAFRNEAGETRSITTSDVNVLSRATLLASHRLDDALVPLPNLPIGKVQSVGSAGLKGSLVAEGTADIYLSPGRAGKLWDACAIDALLSAAGGSLTDSYGHALDYRRQTLDNETGLLATNGPLHDAVLSALADYRFARASE